MPCILICILQDNPPQHQLCLKISTIPHLKSEKTKCDSVGHQQMKLPWIRLCSVVVVKNIGGLKSASSNLSWWSVAFLKNSVKMEGCMVYVLRPVPKLCEPTVFLHFSFSSTTPLQYQICQSSKHAATSPIVVNSLKPSWEALFIL